MVELEARTTTETDINNLLWSQFEHIDVTFDQGSISFKHKIDRDTLLQVIDQLEPEYERIGLEFENGQVKLFANTKLLSIIPTQYILYLTPTTYEGRLALQLERVSLGRLPINKSFVISSLKQDSGLTVKDSSIIITDFPEALVFEQVTIQDEHIAFRIKVQINSIRDALDLVDFVIPRQLLEQIF
ncbi:MAG: hypothetical protein LRY71_18465 [Bacillaceae bacterium]|nr:hypothetical protein [Bacillaceae bacterium]